MFVPDTIQPLFQIHSLIIDQKDILMKISKNTTDSMSAPHGKEGMKRCSPHLRWNFQRDFE
jgi:hypothetical protein